jgi:hypothetical protein
MNRRIIHQVWVGDSEMPPLVRRWREDIERLHPAWEHRLWTESTIGQLPRSELLGQCLSQSSRANIVRLAVISVYGGIYLDCDCEVIRPLDSLLDHEAFAAKEDSYYLCNAVFGAMPNHPWIQWQLNKLPKYVAGRPPWGPALMTAAPRDRLTIVPTRLFYPFHCCTPVDERRPAPDSYLIHHWMKTWNAAGSSHDHPEPDVPAHSYHRDYRCLLRTFRPRLVVEWGSGLNTHMALAVGAEVFSIVDDSQRLPGIGNSRLSLAPRRTDGADYLLTPTDADLFFIDGRNRARCLEIVHDRARRDAIVCLHDAQRAAYRPMLLRFPFVLEPSVGFAVATRDEGVADRLRKLFQSA